MQHLHQKQQPLYADMDNTSSSKSVLSDHVEFAQEMDLSPTDYLRSRLSDRHASDKYQHESLVGDHHIRLLRLVRRLGKNDPTSSTDSLLDFDLEHFDLQRGCPEYKALSYVWGSPEAYAHMPMTNGKSLPTTRNLFEALCYVVHASKLTLGSWLWVDQICIDQSNVVERNQQVQIMGKIFKNAAEVVVWLGISTPALERACDLLPEDPQVRKYYELSGIDRGIAGSLVNIERGSWKDNPNKMLAFEELFERPWFRRAWVVQEAALARLDSVLLGSKSTTLLQLYAIAWVLLDFPGGKTKGDFLTDSELITARRMRPSVAGTVLILREMIRLRGNATRLIDVLNNLGGLCEASDPKDLIYGFCGICVDASPFVTVDYSLPLVAIFRRTAKSLIESENSLRILGHCQRPQPTSAPLMQSSQEMKTLDDLPSWVPNWSLPLQEYPLDSVYQGRSLKYNASGGYSHHTQYIQSETSCLRVRGKILTDVRVVQTKAFDIRTIYKREPVKNYDLAELIAEICPDQAPASSDKLERLMKLLIERGTRVHRINEKEFGLLVQRLLSAYNKSQILPPHQIETLREPLVQLYDLTFQTLDFRRLVRSSDGKLGLAPRKTRPGDFITILHGSEVPIILRQSKSDPEHYTLIGQCYLEDAMMGEAVTWKEGEADEYIIV